MSLWFTILKQLEILFKAEDFKIPNSPDSKNRIKRLKDYVYGPYKTYFICLSL